MFSWKQNGHYLWAALVFVVVFIMSLSIGFPTQPSTNSSLPVQKIAQAVITKQPGSTDTRHLSPKAKRAYVSPPANCTEARRRGIAPIYRGDPNYSESMDGDDDGIACEPYHGKRY